VLGNAQTNELLANHAPIEAPTNPHRDTSVLADVTALDFDFGDRDAGVMAMMTSGGMTELGNSAPAIEAEAMVYLVAPFSMGDMMPGP
jgi:hypothetical protein